MDDDFPPREPPRFWIAVSIFVATLALIVFMLVYTTVRAEAQPACEPLAKVIDDLGSKFQEVIVWEGTSMPRGGPPAQVLLFQSPKGTWTLLALRDGGMACLISAGADGSAMVALPIDILLRVSK